MVDNTSNLRKKKNDTYINNKLEPDNPVIHI